MDGDERKLCDDMQLVFGQMPGQVMRVGITTGSNNLRTTASAKYGDVFFRP